MQREFNATDANILVNERLINVKTLGVNLSKEEFRNALLREGYIDAEINSLWNKLAAQEALNESTKENIILSKKQKIGSFVKSLGVGGAVSALTTVVSLVGGVVNAIKRYKENLRQAADSAASEWQSSADSIENYKSQLTDLHTKLADSNISEEDAKSIRSQLLEIQTALNEEYGKEAAHLNIVNGELTEQLGLLNDLSGKKAAEWYAEHAQAAEEAKKIFAEVSSDLITDTFVPGSIAGMNNEAKNELLSILKEFNIVADEFNNNGYISTTLRTGSKDLLTKIEDLTGLNIALTKFGKDWDVDIIPMQELIAKKLGEYTKLRDEHQQNYELALKSDLYAIDFADQNGDFQNAFHLFIQLDEAVQSYNEALASGDISKIEEADSELNKLCATYNYFASQHDEDAYDYLFDPILGGIVDVEEYMNASMPVFGGYMNAILRSFGVTPNTSNIKQAIQDLISKLLSLEGVARRAAAAVLAALQSDGLINIDPRMINAYANGYNGKSLLDGISLNGDAIDAKQNEINARGSGYSSSGGGGGGSSSPYSEAYEAQKELTEHYIEMSELRQQSMEEDSDQWRYEQQQQLDYYMRIAELIKAEMARLKAAGVSASSEAMRSLEKEYQSVMNSIYDIQKQQFEAWKQAQLDAIDEQIEAAEKAHDKLMDQYDARIKKQEALIDLEEKYHDILNSLREEQNELDKQYSMAQDAYVTASPAEREALFSTEDYKELSGILSGLEGEVDALYTDYWAKLESVTAENIYMADYYTSQLETQLDLVASRYEIAKQELAVAKAKIALENTLQERNVATLVNGKWTWVADPDAVQSAMDEMYDAEQAKADAQSDYIHSQKLAEMSEYLATLEMEKAAAEMEHEKLMDQLQDQRDAIEDMTFNANLFATGVGDAYNTLASGISSGMSAISGAISSGIAAVGAAASAASASVARSAASASSSRPSGSSSSSKKSGLNPGGYELADQWWTPWYEDEADRILKNAAVLEEAGIPYQIVTDDIGRSYITYEGFSLLNESWEEGQARLGAIEGDATGGMYDYFGNSNNPNYLKDTIGISREELNQSELLAGLSDKTIYNAYTYWGNNAAAISRDGYVNTIGFGTEYGSFGGAGWIKAEDVVSEIAKIGEFDYLENIGIGYIATALPYKHKYSFSEGGIVDYQGIALVHGKSNRPEMVLNNADTSKLYNLIHNTPNLAGLIAEKFKSALAPNGKVSGALNRVFGSTTDNSKQIYVNGVEIKGADGDNLISIFERVLPTLT